MLLLAVQEEVNIEENRKLVGTEVLARWLRGRAARTQAQRQPPPARSVRDGRLVHFLTEETSTARPDGDAATVSSSPTSPPSPRGR